jgi:biopolymer transport protein ExbD
MFFLFAVVLMISLSMTQNQGLNVNVPGAGASEPQNAKDKDSLTVTVTDKGEFFVGREKVSLPQLNLKCQTLKNSGAKDPKVVINGASEAPYRFIVQATDEAKKVGIQKVIISVKKN